MVPFHRVISTSIDPHNPGVRHHAPCVIDNLQLQYHHTSTITLIIKNSPSSASASSAGRTLLRRLPFPNHVQLGHSRSLGPSPVLQVLRPQHSRLLPRRLLLPVCQCASESSKSNEVKRSQKKSRKTRDSKSKAWHHIPRIPLNEIRIILDLDPLQK